MPLGEGALQSITSSPLPLNTGSGKASSAPAGPGDKRPNSNRSNYVAMWNHFFNAKQALRINQNRQRANQQYFQKQHRENLCPGTLEKLIWHALDNLGVPMFVGKDNDLDPSLRQAYVKQPTATSKIVATAHTAKNPRK